ncbi:cutinase [Colletotrichum sublineola]|nr:cutinase [Colletotrichum sublineola]
MLSLKAAASLFNIFLLAYAAPSSKRQSNGAGSCTDLHIFLGRGWNEPYPGRQQVLYDVTCSGLASCDYEDIRYDATNTGSVESGRASGISQLRAYTQRCPNSRIALSGYSQGANVVADMLADSGLSPNAAPANQICAALLFGDPNHVASQSYNVGGGAGFTGRWPRSQSSAISLNNFAGVLRSWCNVDDSVCASNSGQNGGEYSHTNYFQLYTNEAAAFIREKCSASSPPGTPEPAPPGSTCVAGRVRAGQSENYTGLCSFSCSYGYCPEAQCECTAFGQPGQSPGGDGRDGCPAPGLDDSYRGLCSFSCSRNYCPAGACVYC